MRQIHLNNLNNLANFLETEITDTQFDIGSFLVNTKSREAVCPTDPLPEKCNSIGCAIGWSITAFPDRQLTHLDSWYYVAMKLYGTCESRGVGYYMFSSDWGSSVNRHETRTREAAIKRIREVIESKGVLTKAMKDSMYENEVSEWY